MSDSIQRRRNSALLWGTALTFVGLLGNVVAFKVLVSGWVIWLMLLIGAAGFILLLAGLTRAFVQPQVFRGKVTGSILTVVSLLLFAVTVKGLFDARALPASAGAPKIGQRAPEFTLTDTTGQAVSLAQLLSTVDASSGKTPKAVLLVFYRGYW